MGDQTEEARDEEEEEEEEESEMDDLNAEKRDFREKDEVDEREEVEKDEQKRGGDPRRRIQSPQIQSRRDAGRRGVSSMDEQSRVWIEGFAHRSLHDRRRSA